jgi:hypothetical protein
MTELSRKYTVAIIFMWHEWQTGELHSVLVGRHEVKRPLGRLRRRNVRKGDSLKGIELGWWVIMKRSFIFQGQEIKWIGLAQDGEN